MNSMKQFKDWLQDQGLKNFVGATQAEISFFERKGDVVLPEDLKEYFSVANGTAGEYDEKWFCFYPLREFHTLGRKFSNWQGVPNYSNLENSLNDHETCYAFADYQCHLITFAIRLYKNESVKNEVYEIIGSEFRIVANSYADFIVKYLNDSEGLQF